jgi:hypothetical protein
MAGRPVAPLAGPALPGPDSPQTRQGRERVNYTRGGQTGDVVAITKHYELKVDAGGNSPALDLTGDAEISFDIKEGLPRTVEFKGALKVGSGNDARRTPLTVSYKLLAGEERDRALAPMGPAVGPQPFPPIE